MATFRPGQVIRFTYKHFWPRDANSRGEQKEILVLHTNWNRKVHGVDMKALTSAQRSILQIVMDPRFNRDGEGRIDIKPQQPAPPPGPTLEQLKQAERTLDNRMHLMRARALAGGFAIHKDTLDLYNQEKANLKQKIDNYTEQDSRPVSPAEIAREQIPPAAREILSQMKPARMVNNPYAFYNRFIRRFLHGIDAYRTFFRWRMDAVQVDPRWNWVSVPPGGPPPGPTPQKPAPAVAPSKPRITPMKFGEPPSRPLPPGAPQELGQKISTTTGAIGPGVHPVQAGAAQGGVLGTKAGVGERTNKRGIKMPVVKKPGRPK